MSLGPLAWVGAPDFQLTGPYRINLALGTSVTSSTSTTNAILYDTLTGFGIGCSQPNQTFSVLALNTGAGGSVISVAADFSSVCPNGSSPYTGSVRVNRTIPLP